jgi:hypothetical protein
VDAQRRLLAAASQRDDRALERPSNLTGGAAGKVVPKLLTGGLVEEIQSRGSLSVWRPDGDDSFTLRISKKGLRRLRLYEQLGLNRFWAHRLRSSQEGTCWQDFLQTLVCID